MSKIGVSISRRRALLAGTGVVLSAALTLTACGSSSSKTDTGGSSSAKVKLSLVAYSTPQAAYQKLIAAFQKTDAGKNVTFSQSYGASGDQSRAVVSGLKADIVAFSLAPDMTRLVKAKLVDASWDSDQYKGMITDSVVVLATRKGNPKNIKTWTDLIKPGVSVIVPNPITSGGARWDIMAAYGAASNKGADKTAGVDYLKSLFKNVSVQDDSARKSLQTFTNGKGDVLISYENDAVFAQQNNQPIDFTIPDQTILIENPIAVTSDSAHPKEAKAFVDFLHTKQAQEIYADNGYRPIVKGVTSSKVTFTTPSQLFTINDLGGWTSVTNDFFDVDKGIVTAIEKGNGVPTSK
ncbi:MAG: sulfate transporter, periplasmic sulfate-binding protein [Mycobacterium sp.]|nr:sulfate transporter, periplasmic sulfate-binding protein [Mycobacterium sp.]